MDEICYTCGDRGWAHLRVVCSTCKELAVHRYCMKLVCYTGEIEWSCEDCKSNTNPVEQCKKVIKDVEINEFGAKRKRDKEEDFCQNNGNVVLVVREENVTNTATSLSSDPQGWSIKGLEENSGVKVNRKRIKETGHHLDNNNQDDTKVETDPLPKSDGNKVDSINKLYMEGRKARVGEAVTEEIQDDRIYMKRAVQIEQNIPSCGVKGECRGKTVITKGELLLKANVLERDNLASQNGENSPITDTCITATGDKNPIGYTHPYPTYQKTTRDVGLHQINESYLVRDSQADQNDQGETVEDNYSGASIGENQAIENDKTTLKGDALANFVGTNVLTADLRVYQNNQNALSAETGVVRDSNVAPVPEVEVNNVENNASDEDAHPDLLDPNTSFRDGPDNRNTEAIAIEESQVVDSSNTAYIRETLVDGRDENALARYQLQAGRCTVNASSEGKWATRYNRTAFNGKICVAVNDNEFLMRDTSLDAKIGCSLVGQNHNSDPGEVILVGEKDKIDAIEEICIVGNDKSDPLSEIQACQSDKDVSIVTAEPAPISALLVESDFDVRNKSNDDQVQGLDHQCKVSGRSSGHVNLVYKLSDVQKSSNLLSRKTIQSTTLGLLPAEENDKGMCNQGAQLDRTNSAVYADRIVKSDKHKPARSNEDAKVGDAQVGGMNKKISLIWKAPLRTVRPGNALTLLSGPRSNKAHVSAQSEPTHMIKSGIEQETHDLRSCKVDDSLKTDAVDGVQHPIGANNVHDLRFRRSQDVKPEEVDQSPEFLEGSNGDLRGKSMDLIHRQSLEPKVTNFGYVPVQSLFDFVWNGWFKIEGTGGLPLAGHTSTMIRVQYKDVLRSLPQEMLLEKVSYPCRFKTIALTGHHVDLFFFPWGRRVEEVVDAVITDMLNGNHVLKFKIDDIELHILSSFTFPEPSRRFQGRCYLWGMFSPAS